MVIDIGIVIGTIVYIKMKVLFIVSRVFTSREMIKYLKVALRKQNEFFIKLKLPTMTYSFVIRNSNQK